MLLGQEGPDPSPARTAPQGGGKEPCWLPPPRNTPVCPCRMAEPRFNNPYFWPPPPTMPSQVRPPRRRASGWVFGGGGRTDGGGDVGRGGQVGVHLGKAC